MDSEESLASLNPSPKLPVLEPQADRQQVITEPHHQEMASQAVGPEMLAFLRYYIDPLSKDPRTGIPDIDRYGDFILRIQALREGIRRIRMTIGYVTGERDDYDRADQTRVAQREANERDRFLHRREERLRARQGARFADYTGPYFDPVESKSDGDDYVKEPAAEELARETPQQDIRASDPMWKRQFNVERGTDLDKTVCCAEDYIRRRGTGSWKEPTRDNEIDIERGELVTDVEKFSRDWWLGTNEKGERGVFPSANVQLHWYGRGVSKGMIHFQRVGERFLEG